MRRARVVFVAACMVAAGCEDPRRPDASDVAEVNDGRDAADEQTPDADGGSHVDAFDASDASDDAPGEGGADADADDAPRDGAEIDAGPREIRALNACDPAGGGVSDMRDAAAPSTLSASDFAFHPPCIRLRAGQTLTFRIEAITDWRAHPVSPGEVGDAGPVLDPSSPIPRVSTGSAEFRVTFPFGGSYGFVCDRHWARGHFGAVHVEP